MQCILYKIYFWKGFSYVLQIDMYLICTPMLAKFYSCKKWVLHLVNCKAHYDLSWFRPLLEGNSSTSSSLILKMNRCYNGLSRELMKFAW
jgi:hypothetical protein